MIIKPFDKNKIKNATNEKFKKGYQNEKEAAYFIDFHFGNSEIFAVLHDLKLQYNGRTVQIDHLLMSNAFVYVIESKLFSGKVSISDNGQWNVQYKNQTYTIPSPIKQNERHIEVVEDILKNSGIIPAGKAIPMIINSVMLSNRTVFNGKIPEEVFFAENIADWSQKERIRKLTGSPLNFLKTAFTLFDEKEISTVAKRLLKYDVLTVEEKIDYFSFLFKNKDEVEESQEDSKEEVFNRLKEIRLEIAREEKIEAFKIFSNKTLEEIAEKRPKNKAELMKISGVGEVKADKYGDRFII